MISRYQKIEKVKDNKNKSIEKIEKYKEQRGKEIAEKYSLAIEKVKQQASEKKKLAKEEAVNLLKEFNQDYRQIIKEIKKNKKQIINQLISEKEKELLNLTNEILELSRKSHESTISIFDKDSDSSSDSDSSEEEKIEFYKNFKQKLNKLTVVDGKWKQTFAIIEASGVVRKYKIEKNEKVGLFCQKILKDFEMIKEDRVPTLFSRLHLGFNTPMPVCKTSVFFNFSFGEVKFNCILTTKEEIYSSYLLTKVLIVENLLKSDKYLSKIDIFSNLKENDIKYFTTDPNTPKLEVDEGFLKCQVYYGDFNNRQALIFKPSSSSLLFCKKVKYLLLCLKVLKLKIPKPVIKMIANFVGNL